MIPYAKIEQELKTALNSRYDKTAKDSFKRCLKELKQQHGREVSTKFLKNLIDSNSNRQKTHKVNNLLRACGLKTYRGYRRFRELTYIKKRVEVVEYRAIEKKPVYSKRHELTDEEQELLNRLSESGAFTNSGFIFDELDSRNNRRDAINKGGAVEIAKSKKQGVGQDFIKPFCEVLFFIQV